MRNSLENLFSVMLVRLLLDLWFILFCLLVLMKTVNFVWLLIIVILRVQKI